MKKDKYSIEFLRVAEEDFTEIIEYISEDNPSAANSIADKIEKNISLLSSNPYLGRTPRDPDIQTYDLRYLIVENYLIFYSVEPESILIHRIIHAARNYKGIL